MPVTYNVFLPPPPRSHPSAVNHGRLCQFLASLPTSNLFFRLLYGLIVVRVSGVRSAQIFGTNFYVFVSESLKILVISSHNFT